MQKSSWSYQTATNLLIKQKIPSFPRNLAHGTVTPKKVKRVITNLYSSKASGPDYIRVVILKNCESQLSYILAEFFSVCLKWSYFPDCWKISLVVPVFRMLGKNLHLKTTALLIFFLWLVKTLKNLLIIGFLIT